MPNLSTGQIRLFLSDAFLSERDAHCVRDAGFACGARLRRVCGTHRITYHSNAASLITYLQTNTLIESSPVVSTIHEKSERLHDRKCVRIFWLYQRYYILMLKSVALSVLWVYAISFVVP